MQKSHVLNIFISPSVPKEMCDHPEQILMFLLHTQKKADYARIGHRLSIYAMQIFLSVATKNVVMLLPIPYHNRIWV